MNSELLLAQQEIINEILKIPLTGKAKKDIFDEILLILTKTPWLKFSNKGAFFLCDFETNNFKLLSSLNLTTDENLLETIPVEIQLCLTTSEGNYQVPIKNENNEIMALMILYVEHGHKKDVHEVFFLEEIAAVVSHLIIQKRQERIFNELAEKEALHAMVTTYNHEINNPLTIAMGALNKLKDHPDQMAIEKLSQSLKRIQEVMIQIQNLPLSKTTKDNYANLSEIFVLSRDTHFPIHILNSLDKTAIISATDLDGNITYFNDLFVKISGYNHDELIGKNHRMLKSERHPSAFFQGMWSTIKAGKIWHGEICNKKKNGEEYWVDSRIIPYHDGYISIRFDTTHLKQNVF